MPRLRSALLTARSGAVSRPRIAAMLALRRSRLIRSILHNPAAWNAERQLYKVMCLRASASPHGRRRHLDGSARAPR